MNTVFANAPPATGTPPKGDLRARLAEVVAYIGAALVLAAAALVVGQTWEDLSTGAQVGLLSAVAVVLIGAGFGVGGFQRGLKESRLALQAETGAVRRRLSSTLLIGGGLAAASAVGVGLEPTMDEHALLPAALTGGMLALAAWWLTGTVITELALLAGLLTTLGGINTYTDLAEPWPAVIACGVGLGWALLAVGDLLRHRVMSEAIGLFLALNMANSASIGQGEEPPAEWPAFVLLAVVAALAFTVYVRTRDWPGVVVGLLATVFLVIRMVQTYTEGAGTALGIMLAGVVLLLGSWLAWRGRPVAEPTEELPEVAAPGWALPEWNYRSAFAVDPVPHAIVDSERHVIDGNEAMAEALHVPLGELRGTVLDVLLAEHPEGVRRTDLSDGTTLVTLR